MFKRLTILAALLFLAAPCLAQKIYIDYDKEADFTKYNTFAWAKSEETSIKDTDPLVHSRIVHAIQYRLTQGGMTEDDANPDCYVTYHTNEKEEMQLNTSSFGYGYGGGMYRDPYWSYGPSMGSSTTSVYTYTRGTLIVDLWDSQTKKLIWRGAAEAILKDNPEKLNRQIDKMLDKMVTKWQKMKKQEGIQS